MFLSPSMLERVYMRGSLKNTEQGFEFSLRNNVDSGTMSAFKSLTVDGVEVPLASIIVKTQQMGNRSVEEITARSPLYLRYGAEMTIQVAGQTLAAGEHALAIAIIVLETGRLEIKVKDVVE